MLESGDSPALAARADALRREGIAVHLGTPLDAASFAALPIAPQRVIVSPGIRWDHPTLVALREQGIRTDGEISTAWEATAGVPWIGIRSLIGRLSG